MTDPVATDGIEAFKDTAGYVFDRQAVALRTVLQIVNQLSWAGQLSLKDKVEYALKLGEAKRLITAIQGAINHPTQPHPLHTGNVVALAEWQANVSRNAIRTGNASPAPSFRDHFANPARSSLTEPVTSPSAGAGLSEHGAAREGTFFRGDDR